MDFGKFSYDNSNYSKLFQSCANPVNWVLFTKKIAAAVVRFEVPQWSNPGSIPPGSP